MIANGWNVVHLLDSAFVIDWLPNWPELLSNTTCFVLSFYRRRCRIFIFRSEEAIDYLFFGEKKPSTIFRTEEPIGSLFFDFFSDRKSRRLSIFRLFFSGRRSHRLFIFLTKEAVHFLFSCRFSLFNDFSVPVENCNFDVFYLFPYLHQAAYNWAVFAVCCSCPVHTAVCRPWSEQYNSANVYFWLL